MNALRLDREGLDWPHREASRMVRADGIDLHVQITGDGPPVLLLHGTGASTHSWRDVTTRLAPSFTVIAVDLPGHGFSERPRSSRLSLDGMAATITALLAELAIDPHLAVGHSAGAAILIRMAQTQRFQPQTIVSVNGALLPFQGFAGVVFSPIAKLLVLNPLAPQLAAWRADDVRTVERLIEGTGSKLDDEGLAYYQRLFSNSTHTGAALAMMAKWELEPLRQNLPKLQTRLLLVVGDKDTAIAPDQARRVRRMVKNSEIIELEGLGHLAHEEDPEKIVSIIVEEARGHGLDRSAA